MTEYEKNKWIITNKVIEIAELIKKQEENADKIAKVNIYLLRKYKDDLLKEFELEVEKEEKFINNYMLNCSEELKEELIINKIYEEIAKRMNEEMPEPWYCYGFGGAN